MRLPEDDLSLLLVVVDARLRSGSPPEVGAMLMRRLQLSQPSLVPSGRPLRQPGALLPGVDLRHVPSLPLVEPGPPVRPPEAGR